MEIEPMDVYRDRAAGCLLGLALGDALGAPHEGGILERLLWRAIGTTGAGGAGATRWTDDTQMALDLAETLVANRHVQLDDLARRFASSYRWSRGYGPGTARMLRRIRAEEPWQDAVRSVYRRGSYGNGAAMRAPVVGTFYATRPGKVNDVAMAGAFWGAVNGAGGLPLKALETLEERDRIEATARALSETDPDD